MEAVQKVDLATARVDVGPLTTFPLVPPIEGSMFFEEVGRAKQHPLSRATCISPSSPSEYYGLWDRCTEEGFGVSPTTFPTSLLQSTPFLTYQKAKIVAPPCGVFDDGVVIPVGLTEHFNTVSARPLRVHHRDPMLREYPSSSNQLLKAIERNYLSIVTPVVGSSPADLSFDTTGRSIGATLVREVSSHTNVREIRVQPPRSGDCHHGTMIQQIYDVVADHCSYALKAVCTGDTDVKGATFVVTGLDAIDAFVDVLDEFHMVLWALSSLLSHYSTHETTSIVTPEGSTVLRTFLRDQAASETAALAEQRLDEQRVAKKKGLPPTTIHQQAHIAAMEDSLSQPTPRTPFDVIHSAASDWFVRVVILLPPHLCTYPSALSQHVRQLLCLGVASVDWPVLSPAKTVGRATISINRRDITVAPTELVTTTDGSITSNCIDAMIDATVDFMVSLHNKYYDDNNTDSQSDTIEAGSLSGGLQVVPIFVPDSGVASRLRIAIDDQYTSEPINVVLGFGDESSLTLSNSKANVGRPSLTFIVCLSGVVPTIRFGSISTTLSATTQCVESEGLVIGVTTEDGLVQFDLEGTVVHMGLAHSSSKISVMGTNNTVWEVLCGCKLLSTTTGRSITVVIPTIQSNLSDFNHISQVFDDRKVFGPKTVRSISRVSKGIIELCRRFRCSDIQQSMGVALSNAFYKDHVLASEQRHKLRANRRLQRQRESENGVFGGDFVSDEDGGDEGRSDSTVYQQVLPKDVDPQSQIFLSLRLLSGPSVHSYLTDALHYLIHGDYVVPTHVVRVGGGVSVSLVLSVLGQRIGGALLPQNPSTSCISPNLPYLKYALCASAIGVPEYHISSKVRSVCSGCPWESDADVRNVLVSFLEILLRIPFRSVHLDQTVLDSRTSVMDELCQQWAHFPVDCNVTGAQFLLSPFVRRERLVPPKLLLGASIGTQVPCRGWYTESAPVVVPEAVLNRDGEYLSLDQQSLSPDGADTNSAEADQKSIMTAIIQRNITSLSTAQIVTESKKSNRQKRGRRVETANDTVDRIASVATPLGLSQELDLTKPGMGYMKPLTAVARFPSILSEVVKVSIVDPVSALVSSAPNTTVTIPAASLDLCLVVKAVLRNALFNTCVVLDGPAILPLTGCSAAMGDTANALVSSITSTLRGYRSDSTTTSTEDFEKALSGMISSTLFPTLQVSEGGLCPSGPLSVYQLPKALSQSSTFASVLSALMFPSDSQSSIWADSLSSAFDEAAEISVMSSHLALSRDNMLHTSSGLPSLSGVCAHTQFRSLDVAQSVKRMKNPPPSSSVNDALSNYVGKAGYSGPTPERGEDRIIEKVIQSIKKIGRVKVERASMGKPLFGFLDPANTLHPYYLNALKEHGIFE